LPPCQCLSRHLDSFLAGYEGRYRRRCGFLRPTIPKVVDRFACCAARADCGTGRARSLEIETPFPATTGAGSERQIPSVRRLTTIGGGKADVFVIDVPESARIAGKKVREIVQDPKFPDQCVIIAAYNHNTDEFVIPRGEQVIREGDELFPISSGADIKAAVRVLTARRTEA
jgi:hypothetical protein